jgi:hypothetical protein
MFHYSPPPRTPKCIRQGRVRKLTTWLKEVGPGSRDLPGAERGWSQRPRAPMLLSEFDGALFQFAQREPEFAALFQLPPKIAASGLDLPHPLPFEDLIQAFSIPPTSAKWTIATRCWFCEMSFRLGSPRKRNQNRKVAKPASAA